MVAVSTTATFLEGTATFREEADCIRLLPRVAISPVAVRDLVTPIDGPVAGKVTVLVFRRTPTAGQVTVTVFGTTKRVRGLPVFLPVLGHEVGLRIGGVISKSRPGTGIELVI